MFFAAPQIADPAANKAIKRRRFDFLPSVDASPPIVGRTAAAAIAYELPTHIKSDPPRSSTMVGRAVDTIVYEVF